jgi:competence protein ComFA
VAAFRKGNLPILVTTTILERGVTIPKLDVAVLGADEAIFDERALVQIGGRVGRAADHPEGDLVFFHQGLTVAMLKALRHIRAMNREAKDIEKS